VPLIDLATPASQGSTSGSAPIPMRVHSRHRSGRGHLSPAFLRHLAARGAVAPTHAGPQPSGVAIAPTTASAATSSQRDSEAFLANMTVGECELNSGAVLNCVRGIMQEPVLLQLLVSEKEAREPGFRSSVSTTGTTSHKWEISDGLYSVHARALPMSTAALTDVGRFGTFTAVLSKPSHSPELLLEDVEVNHAAGPTDQRLRNPTPFFMLPIVHAAHQAPVLAHFPGILGSSTEHQYVKPYSCRGQCRSCNVHLDGASDGAAMVATVGCVAAVRGCPRFEDSGVHDAPRKETQKLELPLDGSDPPNRVKRYAIYYYFATEV
jgi:hypothetical protein